MHHLEGNAKPAKPAAVCKTFIITASLSDYIAD